MLCCLGVKDEVAGGGVGGRGGCCVCTLLCVVFALIPLQL